MGKIITCTFNAQNKPALTHEQIQEAEILAQMTDENIDYSDIPKLDENFWRNAKHIIKRHQ